MAIRQKKTKLQVGILTSLFVNTHGSVDVVDVVQGPIRWAPSN